MGMEEPRVVLLLSGKRKSGKDFVAAEIQKRYRGLGGGEDEGVMGTGIPGGFEGGEGGGRYRRSAADRSSVGWAPTCAPCCACPHR